MEEIEAGESRGGSVYNMSMRISEETTDILVAGGDPHFIRQKGMDCDIKWMLETNKRNLYGLLDTASCLRTDYRSLAEFLGIEGHILEDMEMHGATESCTEAIIKQWTKTPGNKMTFSLLYGMLLHPGLVGNMAAAQVIETMMADLGCQVCYLRLIQH